MIIINYDICLQNIFRQKIFWLKFVRASVGRVGSGERWAWEGAVRGQAGTSWSYQQHKPVLENPSDWAERSPCTPASHAEDHHPPPLPPPPHPGPEISTLWRGGRVWRKLPQAELRCRGFSLPERREADIQLWPGRRGQEDQKYFLHLKIPNFV